MGLPEFEFDEFAAGMDAQIFGLREGIFCVSMLRQEVTHLVEFQLHQR
jgi:hypothetical protein